MALAMVSLAGIPPLAGFFGKFLLIRALLERGALTPAYYWLIGVAIVGVVISFYYYLGVVRAIYWSEGSPSLIVLRPAAPTRWALYACIAGMLYLGLYPSPMLNASNRAASVLSFAPGPAKHASGPAAPAAL
jgi:NADH-quinone oxidoreductase subunit N